MGTFIVLIVVYLSLRLYLLSQEFAGEGLRTLAIAYRELDDKYFKMWQKMLEDANSATLERDERISGLYEEIERDLMV
jgi:phospholipid-translocating ATPase